MVDFLILINALHSIDGRLLSCELLVHLYSSKARYKLVSLQWSGLVVHCGCAIRKQGTTRRGDGRSAYHWYPFSESSVPFVFVAFVGLENELLVTWIKLDAWIGIEC
jgi:hypothetical protein